MTDKIYYTIYLDDAPYSREEEINDIEKCILDYISKYLTILNEESGKIYNNGNWSKLSEEDWEDIVESSSCIFYHDIKPNLNILKSKNILKYKIDDININIHKNNCCILCGAEKLCVNCDPGFGCEDCNGYLFLECCCERYCFKCIKDKTSHIEKYNELNFNM